MEGDCPDPNTRAFSSDKHNLGCESTELKEPPSSGMSKIGKRSRKNIGHQRPRIQVQKFEQLAEIDYLDENVKVTDEGQRIEHLQYQYRMLHFLPVEICRPQAKSQSSVLEKKLRLKSRDSSIELSAVKRINLTTNYLKSFSALNFQRLVYLEELDLSENLIRDIPSRQINEHLVNLTDLKLESNQIAELPFLKHIRRLNLLWNPIERVSKNVFSMSVQSLDFDWMPYLTTDLSTMTESYNTETQAGSRLLSEVEILKYEILKRLNSSDKIKEFYSFKDLFSLKIKSFNPLVFEKQLSFLLREAITSDHMFFIDFLKANLPQLKYNKMKYKDEYLIELALIENNQSLTELFMLKSAIFTENDARVYSQNLKFAIKFHNATYLEYLLKNSPSDQILSAIQMQAIEVLIQNFKGHQVDQSILEKLVQALQSAKTCHKKIEIGIGNFPIWNSKPLLSFIAAATHNQNLKGLIRIGRRKNYFENSVLHFAMRGHQTELIRSFLQEKSETTDIFQRNFHRQSPKTTYGGDRMGRKIFWNFQKQFFNLHHKRADSKKYRKEQKKQVEVKPYISIAQLRNIDQRSAMEHLKLNTLTTKKIFSSFERLSGLQAEQVCMLILEKFIGKLPSVSKQLQEQNRIFSPFEIQILTEKLYQTEFFDRRVFLAQKIGKVLTEKQNMPKICARKSLEGSKNQQKDPDIVRASVQVDNELLFEFEIFHSVPILSSSKCFCQTSEIQSQILSQNNSRKGIGLILKSANFSCNRCD